MTTENKTKAEESTETTALTTTPETTETSLSNEGGRPWFDGKDESVVVSKLEQAFSMGTSIIQACAHAEISRAAFYRYIEDKEELRDRFELLRQKPILRAKATLYKALETDPNLALRYLEKFSGEASPETPGGFTQLNFIQQNNITAPIKRKAQANAVKEKLVKIYEDEMFKVMTQNPEVIEGEAEVTTENNDTKKARTSAIPVQPINPHQNESERKPQPQEGGAGTTAGKPNTKAEPVDSSKDTGVNEKASIAGKGQK